VSTLEGAVNVVAIELMPRKGKKGKGKKKNVENKQIIIGRRMRRDLM
jgi:hypothetical protein